MAKKNLKYTLREIVIVIIGITIAFSMNKCSDNRKDKKLRIEYLKNLKSDIEIDKSRLVEIKNAIDSKIQTCNTMISILDSESNNKLELVNMVFKIIKYENFTPKNVTYTTLINSGDLKLIGDFKLKSAIQTHYSNYNELNATYDRHKSLIKDYLGNYLINYTDYDQITLDKLPFLDEVRLKNIVLALTTTFKEKEQATNEAIKSCDVINKALASKIE